MRAEQQAQHTDHITQNHTDQEQTSHETGVNSTLPSLLHATPSPDHPPSLSIRRQLITQMQHVQGNAFTKQYINRLQHNTVARPNMLGQPGGTSSKVPAPDSADVVQPTSTRISPLLQRKEENNTALAEIQA